jgi:hypothetical protein
VNRRLKNAPEAEHFKLAALAARLKAACSREAIGIADDVSARQDARDGRPMSLASAWLPRAPASC